MTPQVLSILRSLDQTKSPKELEATVDKILAKMSVKADFDFDDVPDDAKIGPLTNRTPDTGTISSVHARGLLVEIIMLNNRNANLQKAFKALQGYVDSNYLDVVTAATSWITSKDDALKASDVYNSNWFSQLPYSIEAKIQIAQGLINTCKEYTITNGFWENLTAYQDSSVEFATYKGSV